MQKYICNILEVMRISGIVAAIQLSLLLGSDPVTRFQILSPILIVAISGLTGIESVFFGRYALEQSGYKPSRYQVQSGLNNLAIAISAIIAHYLNWGVMANVALMTSVLIFYVFSGVNHALSAVMDKNYSLKNLMRPLMSLFLAITIIVFMLPIIK